MTDWNAAQEVHLDPFPPDNWPSCDVSCKPPGNPAVRIQFVFASFIWLIIFEIKSYKLLKLIKSTETKKTGVTSNYLTNIGQRLSFSQVFRKDSSWRLVTQKKCALCSFCIRSKLFGLCSSEDSKRHCLRKHMPIKPTERSGVRTQDEFSNRNWMRPVESVRTRRFD